MPGFVRFWFVLAVAAISAALANPLLESASNAGIFGRGNFTDHCTIDVLPAMLVGCVFVCLHLVLRTRYVLARTDRALRGGIGRLLPFAFVSQLLMLYAMESGEQHMVYGHALGGSLWLGAPVLISLAMHAAVCTFVAYAAASLVRVLASATVRAIRAIRALAERKAFAPQVSRRARVAATAQSILVFACHGERAPPPYRYA